jgi:hypothetical protein
MLKAITWFVFSSLLCTGLIFAQQHKQVEITKVTGEEIVTDNIVYSDIDIRNVNIPNQTVLGNNFTWNMYGMTDYATGYDLQSNGSTQQLWYDMNGGSLNAVFTTSQQATPTPTDRTCTYFYSNDGGVTWTNVGNVPPPASATSGFPSIIGYPFSSVVIANHTGLGGGNVRTQLFINSEAGEYDFVNFDPGEAPEGPPIWPTLGMSNNDILVFGSSMSTASNQYTNTFDLNTGNFSGYQFYYGDQAETYHFATSEGGKIAHAYVDTFGGAWFRESTDDGLTWGTEERIFVPFIDFIDGQDTVMVGTIRGINVSYIGETPSVVFETYRVGPTFLTYYPGLPSEIRYWSPDINGGTNKVIADSNNVPFYSNQGVVAVFAALNRPVIGKAEGDNALFVAFFATIEEVATTVDSTRFMAGFFMMSEDAGETWTEPERFTPETNPLLDFRWVSIASVNPVDGNMCTVHLAMVGDPTAGSQVNGAPAGVTAKFYYFTTDITLTTSVEDDFVANTFDLSQNYPNPFNPATQIKYNLAERSNVTLKVYDVLGKEVATLVNTTKDAGSHEVNFDASDLASGMYIYTIKAGSFTQSKKMMLLK